MWLSGSVSYRQHVSLTHVCAGEGPNPTELKVRTVFNKNQVGFLSQGNFHLTNERALRASDLIFTFSVAWAAVEQIKKRLQTKHSLISTTPSEFAFKYKGGVLFCFKNHVTEIMMQQIRNKATKLLITDELP